MKIRNIFKDKLVLSTLISGLFYSLAYPSFMTYIIPKVGNKLVSLNSICICLSGIMLSMIWRTHSDTIYKKYGYLFILESILYTILLTSTLLGHVSMKQYYIVDTLLFCVVSNNIIFGNNKLKALRYIGKHREEYDNNIQFVNYGSNLLGYALNIICNLSLTATFIFITIGICSDNFIYYNVWKQLKNK